MLNCELDFEVEIVAKKIMGESLKLWMPNQRDEEGFECICKGMLKRVYINVVHGEGGGLVAGVMDDRSKIEATSSSSGGTYSQFSFRVSVINLQFQLFF